MKKQENKFFKAGATKQKPIKTKKLNQLGARLGITQDDIKKTLRKRNFLQTSTLLIIAAVATACSFVLSSSPLHYTGASMKDFDFFARTMYNAFGRVF